MAKAKHKPFTDEDDALLSELGVDLEAPKSLKYTPKQERIIAGFEDIQRFAQEHGRLPRHGESLDIFERIYAVRLDCIRADRECMELLRPLDEHGLLIENDSDSDIAMTDDKLLEALGVEGEVTNDITVMKHVRPNAERRSPEEVAQRKPCENFVQFRPLFKQVTQELQSGTRRTILFKEQGNQTIELNDWFILDGQKAIVAEMGKWFIPEHGERDRRLRVVFDNGTESDMLLRSLRRALNKDETSRRITTSEVEAGTLFSDVADVSDTATGVIYVLRSLSVHPFIAQHREVIHKIGVTSGNVNKRVSGARKDPTYLLADVEVVATFKLANLHPRKLEAALQKFFHDVRLDLELKDRFGELVEPREWFLAPLSAIDEAIRRIKDGTIGEFHYDPITAGVVGD